MRLDRLMSTDKPSRTVADRWRADRAELDKAREDRATAAHLEALKARELRKAITPDHVHHVAIGEERERAR
jgi:hypothetical protein